jgi:hypothetical protein
MITKWSYGVNALPQFRYGTLYLREEPWWLALCGWTINSIVGRGCILLHWIRLPSSIKVVRSGHKYSMRDYYGDVGSLWHVYVFDPLFQWHYGHPKHKEYRIEIGYDRVKGVFGERDKEFFADQEKVVDIDSVPCKD